MHWCVVLQLICASNNCGAHFVGHTTTVTCLHQHLGYSNCYSYLNILSCKIPSACSRQISLHCLCHGCSFIHFHWKEEDFLNEKFQKWILGPTKCFCNSSSKIFIISRYFKLPFLPSRILDSKKVDFRNLSQLSLQFWPS